MVKLNQDAYNKSMLLQDSTLKKHVSKLPISVTLHGTNEDEDEENVKNDKEVNDAIYNDDICDSMAKGVILEISCLTAATSMLLLYIKDLAYKFQKLRRTRKGVQV